MQVQQKSPDPAGNGSESPSQAISTPSPLTVELTPHENRTKAIT
jgi:hypothetical protein